MLPIASKILGRIVIDRIKIGIDKKLRPEQAGFRQGKSTTEQIFILRNIIEQSIEWQSSLYINFIDFEKAFDSIHRDSLWEIMRQYGIPGKIINIVKLMYSDSVCAVLDDGEVTEWFQVKTGVKQGCVMSGFLFLLVIDWMMRETTKDNNTGIRWQMTSKLEDLDFADDIALLSSSHSQMQKKTNSITGLASRVGLKVNKKKTKIMRMNNKKRDAVKIEEDDIDDVNEFAYLGAIVSKEGGGEREMNSRINKARVAFTKLSKIWRSKQYGRKTKIKLYKTLVRPVLLYGCETWKMNKSDENRLDSFQYQCLKKALQIFWPNIISMDELNKYTQTARISQEVKRRRWNWIGHVLRKPNDHHCTIALTWRPEGKRKVGRPKTTWRRTVERERKQGGWKTWNEARESARARDKWKQSVMALCATRHEEDS